MEGEDGKWMAVRRTGFLYCTVLFYVLCTVYYVLYTMYCYTVSVYCVLVYALLSYRSEEVPWAHLRQRESPEPAPLSPSHSRKRTTVESTFIVYHTRVKNVKTAVT